MTVGIMTTGSFPRLLLPGVKEIFGLELKQLPKVWAEVFDVKTSDKNFEEFLQLSGIGLASEKGQGAAVEYDSAKQDWAYRFVHITYGKGMRITREAYEDNMGISLAEVMSKELAKSLAQSKDIVCANILNRAFNNSYVYGDGKELCATDHPVGGGATNQNKPTTAVDLSEAALEQAIIDIYNFIGPDGLRVDVMPERLIIPHNLMYDAARLLHSDLRPNTANNDLNALKYFKILQNEPIVWRRLSDTDAWFIRTDRKPSLCVYNRRAPEVDTQNDFDTQDAKYISTERYSVGVGDHRGLYGSAGA